MRIFPDVSNLEGEKCPVWLLIIFALFLVMETLIYSGLIDKWRNNK